MSLKIISLNCFVKDVKSLYKKYKQISKDLRCLEIELQKNPKSGIHIGNNCYKIRLKNTSASTGKSGGFRVIYYYLDEKNVIYLMSIYSKSELSNIDDNKIIEILKKYDL